VRHVARIDSVWKDQTRSSAAMDRDDDDIRGRFAAQMLGRTAGRGRNASIPRDEPLRRASALF